MPVLQRGSALLAVLWLSLALSAIAFSLASTVRGETERTATAVDGIRAYYLATGAIERATDGRVPRSQWFDGADLAGSHSDLGSAERR